MAFKNINLVYKKNRTTKQYEVRLATVEEVKQNYQATMPTHKTGLTKEQRPKKVIGFDDLCIYPPMYEVNKVFLQGDKIGIILDYKTNNCKLFIKGMNGYSGSFINQDITFMLGVNYSCPPEITNEVLKQLPSKDKLVDTGMGLHIQY